MYDDHYGLTGKPFQLTPDPRFYFESATHRKAMSYLGYGLAQGEGFIVVTGEIGAGKTTLVGHLMATVDPARVNAVQITSTQLEGDDILRMAGHSLGIQVEGLEKSAILARLEKLLQDRARIGQRTLLVVDEAQNLPNSALEELRMLSNFQAGANAAMQIFLLGQPEFRDRLNNAPELEQLRQRVIATHHLTTMSETEIGPYLQHRLKLVGWTGRPQFTEAAIATLHEQSGGLPRKLNTLASRVLLLGAIEKRDVIDADTVDAVVADLARDNEQGVSPAAAAHAAAQIPDAHSLDVAARVAMLEAQVEEQDAALRRVLTLLVDWVEADDAGHAGAGIVYSAPAA